MSELVDQYYNAVIHAEPSLKLFFQLLDNPNSVIPNSIIPKSEDLS